MLLTFSGRIRSHPELRQKVFGTRVPVCPRDGSRVATVPDSDTLFSSDEQRSEE